MSCGFLASFPFNLLPFLVLLHFADLGQHNFPEDGPARDFAEAALLHGARRAIWCTLRLSITNRRERRRVRRNIRWIGDVFLVILLHFEGFDSVRELDDLDAAPETGLGVVRTDLGQQVAVACRLTLQPGVLQGHLGRGTLTGVRLEKGEDEFFGILGHVAPVAIVEDDSAATGLFDQVGQILRAKWRVTTEKGVGDNAHGPQVDRLSVTLLKHDLRRGITKRPSHARKDLRRGFQHLCDAKVCQNKRRVGSRSEIEEVFRFQV